MTVIVGARRRSIALDRAARDNMSDSVFGVLDLALAFGLALAWGIRELILLRREARRARREESQD